MPSSDPNLDALMVDWLYDELNPAEARSFEEHLRTHPEVQAELSALKRTRAAFQDMQQVEPAPALSSILLHEAALAVQKQPGFWARVAALFQPIYLHPATSAMATVILLAGVAGALYSRNGNMMAEPVAALSESGPVAVVPTATPAATATPTAAPAGAFAAPVEIQTVDGAKLSAQADYAVDMASEQEEESIQKASTVPLPEKREAKKSVARSFKANKQRPTDDTVIGGTVANAVSGAGAFAQPPEPRTGAKDSRRDGFGDNLELSRLEDGAVRLSDEKTRGRVAKPKQSAPKAPSQELSKNARVQGASWEANQMATLKAAKGKKRCNEVSQIANDILDKKPKYYKDKVAGTKVVGDCGVYVANETRRRSKLRSKQGRKSAPSKRAASPKREATAQ